MPSVHLHKQNHHSYCTEGWNTEYPGLKEARSRWISSRVFGCNWSITPPVSLDTFGAWRALLSWSWLLWNYGSLQCNVNLHSAKPFGTIFVCSVQMPTTIFYTKFGLLTFKGPWVVNLSWEPVVQPSKGKGTAIPMKIWPGAPSWNEKAIPYSKMSCERPLLQNPQILRDLTIPLISSNKPKSNRKLLPVDVNYQ